MRTKRLPRESLLYTLDTQTGDTMDIARGCVRATPEQRGYIFNLLINDIHSAQALLRAFHIYLASTLLWQTTYGQTKPTEYSINQVVMDRLLLANLEDVPLEDVDVSEALVHISIPKTDFGNLNGGNSGLKVQGGMVINLNVLKALGNPFAKTLKDEFKVLLGSYLSSSFAKNRETIVSMLESIEGGIILCSVLENVEFSRNLRGAVLTREDDVRNGHLRNTLKLFESSFLSLPDDEESSELKKEMFASFMGLETLLKSLLFIQQGQFESEKLDYVPPYTERKAPQAKIKYGRKKRHIPPKTQSAYSIKYIQEQTGGDSISWLPSTETVELLHDTLVEMENEEVEKIPRNRAPAIIPDHEKLIWVTEEYVRRNQIQSDDILETRVIGRRYRDRVSEKTRHLIRKKFVYGHGISLEAPKAEITKVGLRRKNPYDLEASGLITSNKTTVLI